MEPVAGAEGIEPGAIYLRPPVELDVRQPVRGAHEREPLTVHRVGQPRAVGGTGEADVLVEGRHARRIARPARSVAGRSEAQRVQPDPCGRPTSPGRSRRGRLARRWSGSASTRSTTAAVRRGAPRRGGSPPGRPNRCRRAGSVPIGAAASRLMTSKYRPMASVALGGSLKTDRARCGGLRRRRSRKQGTRFQETSYRSPSEAPPVASARNNPAVRV